MQLAIDRSQPPAKRWFTRKVISWIKRYLPAELTGAAAAMIGATIAWQLDQSMAVVALVGTWSDVVGFYLTMMALEWRAQRHHRTRPLTNSGRVSRPRWITALQSVRQTIGFLLQILRNLVLEFGPAELVDPLFVRPALLTLALNLLPSMHWAVLSGKVAADLLFYTIAISSVELRRQLATQKACNDLSQL